MRKYILWKFFQVEQVQESNMFKNIHCSLLILCSASVLLLSSQVTSPLFFERNKNTYVSSWCVAAAAGLGAVAHGLYTQNKPEVIGGAGLLATCFMLMPRHWIYGKGIDHLDKLNTLKTTYSLHKNYCPLPIKNLKKNKKWNNLNLRAAITEKITLHNQLLASFIKQTVNHKKAYTPLFFSWFQATQHLSPEHTFSTVSIDTYCPNQLVWKFFPLIIDLFDSRKLAISSMPQQLKDHITTIKNLSIISSCSTIKGHPDKTDTLILEINEELIKKGDVRQLDAIEQEVRQLRAMGFKITEYYANRFASQGYSFSNNLTMEYCALCNSNTTDSACTASHLTYKTKISTPTLGLRMYTRDASPEKHQALDRPHKNLDYIVTQCTYNEKTKTPYKSIIISDGINEAEESLTAQYVNLRLIDKLIASSSPLTKDTLLPIFSSVKKETRGKTTGSQGDCTLSALIINEKNNTGHIAILGNSPIILITPADITLDSIKPYFSYSVNNKTYHLLPTQNKYSLLQDTINSLQTYNSQHNRPLTKEQLQCFAERMNISLSYNSSFADTTNQSWHNSQEPIVLDISAADMEKIEYILGFTHEAFEQFHATTQDTLACFEYQKHFQSWANAIWKPTTKIEHVILPPSDYQEEHDYNNDLEEIVKNIAAFFFQNTTGFAYKSVNNVLSFSKDPFEQPASESVDDISFFVFYNDLFHPSHCNTQQKTSSTFNAKINSKRTF